MLKQTVQAREARVRRTLKRDGYVLTKSRVRNPEDYRYGGYMIVDAQINGVVAGGSPIEFCLDLDDVEKWAASEE